MFDKTAKYDNKDMSEELFEESENNDIRQERIEHRELKLRIHVLFSDKDEMNDSSNENQDTQQQTNNNNNSSGSDNSDESEFDEEHEDDDDEKEETNEYGNSNAFGNMGALLLIPFISIRRLKNNSPK